MKKFTDSLRGYGRAIFERDNFVCAYCGEDHSSFKMWRFLTVDHLLPRGHPDRDKIEWQVTACSFCNTAKNRTKYEINDNTTPQDIIKMKKAKIEETNKEYREFWNEHYSKNKDSIIKTLLIFIICFMASVSEALAVKDDYFTPDPNQTILIGKITEYNAGKQGLTSLVIDEQIDGKITLSNILIENKNLLGCIRDSNINNKSITLKYNKDKNKKIINSSFICEPFDDGEPVAPVQQANNTQAGNNNQHIMYGRCPNILGIYLGMSENDFMQVLYGLAQKYGLYFRKKPIKNSKSIEFELLADKFIENGNPTGVIMNCFIEKDDKPEYRDVFGKVVRIFMFKNVMTLLNSDTNNFQSTFINAIKTQCAGKEDINKYIDKDGNLRMDLLKPLDNGFVGIVDTSWGGYATFYMHSPEATKILMESKNKK